MIVKADVTPEEKARIKELASNTGMSVSSYIRKQALCWTDPDPTPVMKLIETQAPVLQRIDELASTQLQNKVIFEAEILEILDHVSRIEDTTKEALKNGHARQ